MTGERYTLERFLREKEEREAAEKAAARSARIADGGTELTFERHWEQSIRDDIREERVKRAMAERESGARRAMRDISGI